MFLTQILDINPLSEGLFTEDGPKRDQTSTL